jgi:hypothetical protein
VGARGKIPGRQGRVASPGQRNGLVCAVCTVQARNHSGTSVLGSSGLRKVSRFVPRLPIARRRRALRLQRLFFGLSVMIKSYTLWGTNYTFCPTGGPIDRPTENAALFQALGLAMASWARMSAPPSAAATAKSTRRRSIFSGVATPGLFTGYEAAKGAGRGLPYWTPSPIKLRRKAVFQQL